MQNIDIGPQIPPSLVSVAEAIERVRSDGETAEAELRAWYAETARRDYTDSRLCRAVVRRLPSLYRSWLEAWDEIHVARAEREPWSGPHPLADRLGVDVLADRLGGWSPVPPEPLPPAPADRPTIVSPPEPALAPSWRDLVALVRSELAPDTAERRLAARAEALMRAVRVQSNDRTTTVVLALNVAPYQRLVSILQQLRTVGIKQVAFPPLVGKLSPRQAEKLRGELDTLYTLAAADRVAPDGVDFEPARRRAPRPQDGG